MNRAQIRDVATGNQLKKFSTPSVPYADLAWHPEGRLLAASGNDFNIHLWNVETGQEHAVLRGHQALPHGLQFSSGGDVLSSWSWDGTLRLWNPWTGQEVCRLLDEQSGRLSRDGSKLAGRQGKQLLLWEVVGGEEYRTLASWEETSGSQVINGFPVVSPDGRWLAVAQHHGMRLFDLIQGKQAAFLPLGQTRPGAFHPSGSALFTSSEAGLCRWPFVVDEDMLRIGPPEKLFPVPASLALDGQGRFLALSNISWGAGVLDLHKPGTKPRLLRHPSVQNSAISPDGKWAATGTQHGRGVKIWEAETGKLGRDLITERTDALVSFSPDGRQLVTVTNLGVTFWEVGSWKEQRRLAGSRAAWSPDGKLFAVTPSRYHVELQDAATGKTLATLEVPDDLQVFQMAFTPVGDKLVVLSWQPGHVHVWDLRLVRSRLAKMGLDWDAPPYPPAPAAKASALKVELQLVDPIEQATRAQEAQGDKHRDAKEYAEAIACYREVLKSEPHNADIMNRAAWLLAIGPPEVRDGHEALKLSKQVRAWEPTSRWALNTLGAAQFCAGQHEEALRSMRQAEKQFESDKNFTWPLNWLVQALCLAKLGERDAAQAMYQKSTDWLQEPSTRNAAYRNEALLLQQEAEMLLQK